MYFLFQNPPINLQVLKNALAYMDGNKPEAKPEAKEWKFWDTQPVPKFGLNFECFLQCIFIVHSTRIYLFIIGVYLSFLSIIIMFKQF